MTIEHKNIPESGLHEPKGVSTAAQYKVYVADGAGSGAWGDAYIEGQANASANKIPVSDGAGGVTWKDPVHLVRTHCVGLAQAIALTGASIRTASSYTEITQYLTQVLLIGELTLGTNNGVVIAEDGYYDIACWTSITSSATGATISLLRTVDGVAQVSLAASLYKAKSAGDIATLSNSTVAYLTAGQRVSYSVASDTTTTLTLSDAMFKVRKVSL